MTFSASTLFRATALALTAGLSLAACSSTDETPESDGQTHELDTPEAPEATEQETALAETLEEDFDADRSEERRVGKEWRSRGGPDSYKKKVKRQERRCIRSVC